VAQKLEEMLCRYLPEEKLEKRPEEKAKKTETAILDKNAGLSYCEGDEEMYREMVHSFCVQGEKYVSELTKYFSERDWKNYRIIVHSLKSTALVIGANDFSEYAKKMELAAKEEQETLLLAEGESFLSEYAKLLYILSASKDFATEK